MLDSNNSTEWNAYRTRLESSNFYIFCKYIYIYIETTILYKDFEKTNTKIETIKVRLTFLKIIFFDESPLKMKENAFYFILSLFCCQNT